MISVLIPVYNTNKVFLENCIDSCLKQTFQNFEIIIVDNESTSEDTKKFLLDVKNHEKIKVFSCERQAGKKNLSITLNYGLEKCSYDYVARMDSDDIMLSERLSKQLEYMKKNDVDVLGTQMLIIPNKQKTNHPKIITKDIVLKTDWFINHPTVMFKKQSIEKIGKYFEDYEFFGEDYELWLRCLKNGLKIHNLSDTLLIYRKHSNNLTDITKANPEYVKNMAKIYRGFLDSHDFN